MRKELKFFGSELKRTPFFNIMVIIEAAICIILLGTCIYTSTLNKVYSAFYNHSVADKSYVRFNKLQGINVGRLRGMIGDDDIAVLATACRVDGEEYPITVVTPTVVKNMPKLGLDFKSELPAEYREAYVAHELSGEYKRGERYKFKIDYGDVVVEIKGYFKPDNIYYEFNNMTVLSSGHSIIMCDELHDSMTVSAGFFYNDKEPRFYKNLGFDVELGRVYFYENTANRNTIYVAIIVIMVLFASVFVNYMINIDRTKKRFAVERIVGVHGKTLVWTEILKMLLLFLSGFIIALIISAIFIKLKAFDDGVTGGIIDYESFAYSSLIVFGVYVLTVASGMVGLVKIKPLTALKDETKE